MTIVQRPKIDESKYNKKIKGLADVLKELQDKKIGVYQDIAYSEQIENVSERIKLYFRGQSDENWELKPSIFRKKPDEERFCYYETLTKHPNEFKDFSSIDRLAKMQHYGIPTRMLDFTTNAMMALYFACQKKYCITNMNTEKDNEPNGKLYIFAEKETLTFDSDRALILSCLPKLKTEEREEIKNYALLKIKENKDARIFNKTLEEDVKSGALSETGLHAFKKFIYEAERERTAFANHCVLCNDLISAFMVRPQFNNDRIEKQEGLFCIFGLDASIKPVSEITIPKTSKHLILRELAQIGIKKSTLFPDLQSFAESLYPKKYEKACAYCGAQCKYCKEHDEKWGK